jgi:farnesyl diphosphate synthase
MTTFKEQLNSEQTAFDQALKSFLPEPSLGNNEILDAMNYSLFNGGKRVRPILTLWTAQALGLSKSEAIVPAAALEMIHSYSLVHDDLPAMDDDDLRRGKPTCHIVYSEAIAILAGDALQTRAFEIIAQSPELNVEPTRRLKMIEVLAKSSGAQGMVAGQAIDLASVGTKLNLAELENMHGHKTGALICAAVELGALCAPDVSDSQRSKLNIYAQAIGLAFQVQDDILDIESDTQTLGKQQGADIALDKPTYPALLGMEGAKNKAQELYQIALSALDSFDSNADPLRELAGYIVQRSH